MNKKVIIKNLPKTGFSRLSISTHFKKSTKLDLDFNKDAILGSMCSTPPKLAIHFFKKYNSVNLGDPGLFLGSLELENQAISILGNLLHSDKAAGVFTTGGTEANIIAVRSALFAYEKKHPQKNRRELKLLVPESAHFSFDKAAALMGVQLIKVPLNSNYQINIESVKAIIDDNCFCLVGVAGTTGLGMIDPIKDLGKLAIEKGIYFHVDAAFGGFVIPFMDTDFQMNYPFDFSIDGVRSITIDPHKMGRGLTPGGAIIFKDSSLFEESLTEVTYLAGGFTKHLTLVGTRSGAAVIASLSTFLKEGFSGYTKGVSKAMELTRFLESEISLISGYELKTKPIINVLGIKPNFCSAEELSSKLREHNIAVSVFGDFIRIVIMPHVTKTKIRKLLTVLKEISDVA